MGRKSAAHNKVIHIYSLGITLVFEVLRFRSAQKMPMCASSKLVSEQKHWTLQHFFHMYTRALLSILRVCTYMGRAQSHYIIIVAPFRMHSRLI